ncbi:hypothetical protein [Helicobacter sp. MIT 14-3879]|uniref:HP0838 family lipoprotein n=1 Tax=Helicobacter sp. MIT 14-3879 TaxID=2040649 RepID=UPI000E1F1436|nr:hypothetical protein [Helicobacter sp. MIT 14-3879]RDU61358.1 hypothetical protein CQA44_09160 [Helicobacter sp. MIT 14-3879]
MYQMALRIAALCVLGFIINACASNDPELRTQGNLDGIHYKSPNPIGSGDNKGDSVFTPQEQEPQNLITSELKLLYINTAPFKFYDYARLNTYQSGLVKLELFKYAQTIGSIRIKAGRMCVLTECSFKWPISKKFFGAVSYGELFEDIIFGRDIFGGKGKQVFEKNISIQRFQQSGEMIYYERKPGHILFKNMTTGVTIGIDNYEPLSYDSGVRNSLTIPQ